ncbi:MAG: hypothetical protein C0444_03185 [Microbacterium sp.]|nr:hypothetical protein [Microbacterium sp.]MBA4345624.1 hypothetical protein [Microbacterium sp.]
MKVDSWGNQLARDWRVSRLARYARIFAGGTPDRENPDYWTDGDIPWVNSGSVNQFDIVEPSELITQAAMAGSAARWVPRDALLVALAGQGKTKGMAAQLRIRATCNQSMAAIVTDDRLHARFLLWWLTSNYSNLRKMGGGDLRDGLNLQHIASIPVPLPAVDEQRRIAEFLDRETAQIDELIAKQERLISTLSERSAAFRFHLTTGGLEERPRSIASSSPWFPDLPEDWVMAPVKYHARTGAGAGFPPDAQGLLDEKYPFLKVNALSKADDDGVIRWQEDTVSLEMASKLGAKIYPAGSCIIAKIGAALLMGRVRQLSAPSCVDNNVMALIPQGSTSPRFLYYALQNLRPDWLVNPGAVPSTSEGAVGRVRLPFPPEAEQIAIAKALDVYMRKVMATERKLEAALTVLRERRQALISAAVTGQIDVGGAS